VLRHGDPETIGAMGERPRSFGWEVTFLGATAEPNVLEVPARAKDGRRRTLRRAGLRGFPMKNGQRQG